jgi:hypothetical protein
MLELWNKLHFEEKKTDSIYHVKNIQYLYLLNKYMKCNTYRLAVRYDRCKDTIIKNSDNAYHRTLFLQNNLSLSS